MDFIKLKRPKPSIVESCSTCGAPGASEGQCKKCKNEKSIDGQSTLLPVENDSRQLEKSQSTNKNTSTSAASAVSQETGSERTGDPLLSNLSLIAAPSKLRFIAAVLDHAAVDVLALILGIIGAVPLILYAMMPSAIVTPASLTVMQMLTASGFLAGLSFLMPVVYFTWFESSPEQATPGKRLMGLKIIHPNGAPITFTDACVKSILQYVVLEILFVLSAIPIVIFAAIAHINLQNQPLYLITWPVVAIAMCVPFFRSGSQTILDLILGRMVLAKADATKYAETHPTAPAKRKWWHKTVAVSYWISISFTLLGAGVGMFLCPGFSVTWLLWLLIPLCAIVLWERADQSKWQYLSQFSRIGFAGLTVLATCIGLWAALPTDCLLIQDTVKGIPLVEAGYKLDPLGESPESRKLFREASAYPMVRLPYFWWQNIAKTFSDQKTVQAIQYRELLLSPAENRTFVARANFMEERKDLNRALALFKKAMNDPPDRDAFFEASTGVARVQFETKQYAESNKTLTKIIETLPVEAPKMKSNYRYSMMTGQFESELAKVYSLRAQTWKALKKEKEAKVDDAAAQKWRLKSRDKRVRMFGSE